MVVKQYPKIKNTDIENIEANILGECSAMLTDVFASISPRKNN